MCLWAIAGQAAAALTLSPTSVSVPAGMYSVVKITGARGEIQAESRNTAVATVTLTNVTSSSATLNVFGKGSGSTTIKVRDSRTEMSLSVTVTASTTMAVSPTSLSVARGSSATLTASRVSGTLSATSSNTGIATVSVGSNTVTVKGIAAGSVVVAVKDSKTTVNVPVTVTSGTTTSSAKYSLLAWNDLGMHCVDGKDYSVFSILPPFNNLHAQLVNASTGKAVTSGVTLTYEAVADPTGSNNTTSIYTNGGQLKTNFWNWASKLYTNGAPLANDVGLTGNATPSMIAKPMKLDSANGWFEATGLPITPYDDAGNKNFYPTVKVTAKDTTGKVLATATAVLPVSDEITCAACHATTSDPNPARQAAKPAAGWVPTTGDAEKDWKLNILRKHDEKRMVNGTFTSVYSSALSAVGLNANGMYLSALAGKPALCAACHESNALGTKNQPGVASLTSAQHASHGKVIDPTTVTASNPIGIRLDDATNRNACYMCHPGSVTACLRGAMSTVSAVQCQSCHGNMTKVGTPTRVGWLDQPNCQACHFNGKRTTTAVDASGNLIKPADTRFATNANTPAAGFSLFRFSKGHGAMQCESCHGSTHAEYPSTHTNDNLQSIALQGYAGTVRECTVCHATPPLTLNGGPHGMHTIGQTWVGKHGDLTEHNGGPAQCAYCHGSDYRGGPLSQVKAARTFSTETGSRSFAAGQNVGCYDCHNGPNP